MTSSPGKNHLWKKFTLALAVFAVFVVLALAVLPAACSEEEGGDPQAILAAASASMKELKGFHFVYEVHQPEDWQPGSGLYISRITGDVNAEGHMQATVDAVWGGMPVSLGFIALEETHYIQDPLSKKWQAVPAAESPVGTLNLGTGTVQILDRIMEATYVGQDERDGTKTHHLKGKVAAAEVEAIAGAVDTSSTFPTNIWIGVEDHLVYEVDIAGAATPNEDEDIWRSIVLSNFGADVEIEAPE